MYNELKLIKEQLFDAPKSIQKEFDSVVNYFAGIQPTLDIVAVVTDKDNNSRIERKRVKYYKNPSYEIRDFIDRFEKNRNNPEMVSAINSRFVHNNTELENKDWKNLIKGLIKAYNIK